MPTIQTSQASQDIPSTAIPSSSYRDQIAQWTSTLAALQHDAIQPDLPANATPMGVRLFMEDNLDRRCDKLEGQLEFVARAFSDFPEIARTYVNTFPLVAYDTALSDGDRLLAWLQESRPLTPIQRDYVACQRARHAIEELARGNRLAHVRFQERYSLVKKWLAELSPDSSLKLYLNPIRCWTRFVSPALLDQDAICPAHVLFFAQRDEVGSAVLELEGQALLNELADFQPCTIAAWSAVSRIGDSAELTCLTRELATMGIVALG